MLLECCREDSMKGEVIGKGEKENEREMQK